MSSTSDKIVLLKNNIGKVIFGKDDIIEYAIISLLARGHLLIEDVPGVGKSSLAHSLASSLHLDFKRIQFTSDLLPTDITGVSIYDQAEKKFHFQKGPLFSNIVLADEINRTTPRTQSALLEAMNERQISADNTTYILDEPFMVIATQNQVESQGACPLPESQLDRFMLYVSMGYPSLEDERRLLSESRPERIAPVLNKEDVLQLQGEVDSVHIDPLLTDYILNILTATRENPHLALGVSPRGGLIFQQAIRARALVHGRNYCIPDDVKSLAIPVLCHRVIPQSNTQSQKRLFADTATIIETILEELAVPV
ncbi:MAG: MoxR family ATPase [Nitrospinae bacterium]|nr:MoxR family ATPase [Nitrospinota bacterium]MZH15148.1 MoxR family ATPase [Nitrospinota bacterium]